MLLRLKGAGGSGGGDPRRWTQCRRPRPRTSRVGEQEFVG
jgi:hypothetical protein